MTPSPTAIPTCPQCGGQIPPHLLYCPSCQRLVYANELKQLSDQALQAEQENRLSDALAAWRQAFELLPLGSIQRQTIKDRIETLSLQLDGLAPQTPQNTSRRAKPSTSLFGKNGGGKAGLFGLLVVLFSKFKVLLLGLTKLHTLFSMLLFFGIYCQMWGWKFALGFVLSIYIHEMGHVVSLNHYGIKATAPVFIPFVGAIIRVKQTLTDPREDSRVGLAGPTWGLGAALAAYALYYATGDMVFAAIARIGAWINLFNLLPFWQLDGGRGFHALSRWQRWAAVAAVGAAWGITQEGLLLVLMIFGVIKALDRNSPKEPDMTGLIQYVFLVAILSMMCLIPVPTPGH